jgi:hypothetical protein
MFLDVFNPLHDETFRFSDYETPISIGCIEMGWPV